MAKVVIVCMKTKIKRHTFTFTEETDSLLRGLQKQTELSFAVLVKQGLQLLAKEKGFKNDR